MEVEVEVEVKVVVVVLLRIVRMVMCGTGSANLISSNQNPIMIPPCTAWHGMLWGGKIPPGMASHRGMGGILSTLLPTSLPPSLSPES